MDEFEVIEAGDDAARRSAFAIRRTVFCDEQGVAPEEEFDAADTDAATRHYLGFLRGEAAGAARLRFLDARTAKIERVAVLHARRRRGLGAALTRRVISEARAAGAESIVLHAQTQAEGFYAALGFVTCGAGFLEAGIPHVRMVFGAAARNAPCNEDPPFL
ncbi:MAG: GNAT family N-acetyltransferase [Alphaproteobacteria bacterium]|nr:GNAT family N-acetyltransferase [Alphaproteobacteria bacterium]